MVFKFIFLLLAVHTLRSTAYPDGKEVEKKGQLIITNLMWRHGDRNPVESYPGGKYGIEYWPEGWGQLTNVSNNSSPLASGYVPVHTVNVSYDYLISGGVPSNCPAYYNTFNAYLQSPQITQFNKSMQSAYNYLSTSLSTPINDWLTVLLIRDTLLCESIHNLPPPEWSKHIFPNNKEFYELALKYYYAPSATQFLAKFQSGFLLKDILDRFTAKVQRTLTPNYKYYAYSTHDSTLSNFLNSLGVYDFKFVNYAAVIIVELRFYQNEYYVILYYRNQNEQTVDPIYIPQCGTACPLARMRQIYAHGNGIRNVENNYNGISGVGRGVRLSPADIRECKIVVLRFTEARKIIYGLGNSVRELDLEVRSGSVIWKLDRKYEMEHGSLDEKRKLNRN